jgi:hypothetical protein
MLSIGEAITTVIFPNYIDFDFIEKIKRLVEIEREENKLFLEYEAFMKNGNNNNIKLADIALIWN